MGLSRYMWCAAASATALLVATPALAQSVPQSVTIPLTSRDGELFPNVVTVSVGGGPASHVTFDTGSAGLYILPGAIGSYIYAMGANSKLSVSYAGEIAGDVQQNAVKGALSVLF